MEGYHVIQTWDEVTLKIEYDITTVTYNNSCDSSTYIAPSCQFLLILPSSTSQASSLWFVVVFATAENLTLPPL